MSTIYLRFADEAEFLAACAAAGIEPALEITLPDCALSVIGTLYDMADPENPVAKAGWHVNALGTLPDGWEAYAVTPDPVTPARTFGE